MNPEESNHAEQIKDPIGYEALSYIVVPLMAGLLQIFKVFFITGAYAFEPNDEVAHTFLEIPMVWKALFNGTIPYINLFNNFGTPLIGDPVTNAFAPHALTYIFFDPPLAATINLFLMASLSVAFITYLFRRHIRLPLVISSVCALGIFILPHFNYFLRHHPHQGVVLYFTLVLIMQYRVMGRASVINVAGLYISLVVFLFGVGINGFIFGLPFIVVHQFLIGGARFNRKFFVFLLLLIALLVMSYPKLSSFFQWASLSNRTSVNFAEATPFSLTEIITNMIFYSTKGVKLDMNQFVFYSLPLLLLSVLGGFYAFKDRCYAHLSRLFLLGLLPFLLVIVLFVLDEVRASLPLLKSVDVSRFFWFANIYLLAGVGYALQRLRSRKASLPLVLLIVFSTLYSLYSLTALYSYTNALIVIRKLLSSALYALGGAGAYSDTFFASAERITYGAEVGVAIFLFLVFIATILYKLIRGRQAGDKTKGGVLYICALFSLLFAFYPVISQELRPAEFFRWALTGQMPISYDYSYAYQGDFRPKKFLDRMEPYSRISVQSNPVPRGYLQHIAKANIFGTDGRSIIMHGGLRNYLMDRGIIKAGWGGMTYYTITQDRRELSPLGIRYLMTFSPIQNPTPGLKLISRTDSEFLYENTATVGMAYFIDNKPASAVQARRYIAKENIEYDTNTIRLKLNPIKAPADLVLTFINWPGWRVWVNGKEAEIVPSKDFFLRLALLPGDSTVEFRFAPVSNYTIALSALVSLLFFILALIFRPIAYNKNL